MTNKLTVMLATLLLVLAAGVGSAQAASGGPDLFGYQWADSNAANGPNYDFIDISGTGTHLGIKKYTMETLALPFAFPFYGNAYKTLTVAYNGVLTFSPNSYNSVYTDGEQIPNGGSHGVNLIAGLWDYIWPNDT